MPGLLKVFVFFATALLLQTHLCAWRNGELLIWMDSARAHGLQCQCQWGACMLTYL
jgi:hypothetical protein